MKTIFYQIISLFTLNWLYRDALKRIRNELGVPGGSHYPQNVANAWEIADSLLTKEQING